MEVVEVDPSERANKLRSESDERGRKRRKTSETPVSRTSIWTSIAISSLADDKATCGICSTNISVPKKSSSNIIAHYQSKHGQLFKSIEKGNSLDEKRRLMEKAVDRARTQRYQMTLFLAPKKTPRAVSQDLKRRVAGILFIASRSISFDVLGSPQLQAMVNSAGRTLDNSKSVYLEILPDIYKSVATISAERTKNIE